MKRALLNVFFLCLSSLCWGQSLVVTVDEVHPGNLFDYNGFTPSVELVLAVDLVALQDSEEERFLSAPVVSLKEIMFQRPFQPITQMYIYPEVKSLTKEINLYELLKKGDELLSTNKQGRLYLRFSLIEDSVGAFCLSKSCWLNITQSEVDQLEWARKNLLLKVVKQKTKKRHFFYSQKLESKLTNEERAQVHQAIQAQFKSHILIPLEYLLKGNNSLGEPFWLIGSLQNDYAVMGAVQFKK